MPSTVLEEQINPEENYWFKRYIVIEWNLYSTPLYSYTDTQLMTYKGFYDNLINCLKDTKTIYFDASTSKLNLLKPHKILAESDEPVTNLNYPELFV